MRNRIGSTLAIAAIAVGLATSIAGPIYSAIGIPGPGGPVTSNARISSSTHVLVVNMGR